MQRKRSTRNSYYSPWLPNLARGTGSSPRWTALGARGSHYFTHLAPTLRTNIRNISSRARQALAADKRTAGLVSSPSRGPGVPRSPTLRVREGDTESLEAGWELSSTQFDKANVHQSWASGRTTLLSREPGAKRFTGRSSRLIFLSYSHLPRTLLGLGAWSDTCSQQYAPGPYLQPDSDYWCEARNTPSAHVRSRSLLAKDGTLTATA